MWPFADDDVWAVGEGGVALHFDGVSWSPTPITTRVSSLWPESATRLWAIEEGKAKRLSGGVAQDMTPWAGGSVHRSAVAGSGGEVWLMSGDAQLLIQQ